MSNLEKYNDVFMRVFQVEVTALTETFTFADTDMWDSLAHLSLISEIEDAFDIMLDTEDILHYGSYENGKVILKKYSIAL